MLGLCFKKQSVGDKMSSCSPCCCCSFDKVFNYAGWVPALSSVTGLFRMVIGVIEMVVGAIFTILLCQSNEVSWVIIGIKNVFRGMIETVPLIGNVVLIAYDCLC